MTTKQTTVTVWDPLIRIGHWILVIAFFTAYFTEDELMTQHVLAGYCVGIYLLVRVMWGFIGSRYARFSGFIYSPAQIAGYMKKMLSRKPQHYIGHNPAGGVMVMALLISLIGTTLTGLKLYAIEDNKGPLAFSEQPVNGKSPWIKPISEANAKAYDEEDSDTEIIQNSHEVDKEGEALWEELHELFANFTILLVFLHVAGVILASIIDKEALIKTMLTGKKDIDDTYQ